MKNFDEIWKFLKEREERGVMLVQDERELAHICELAKECNSYLEIGTAEGNSLYAIGHSLKSAHSLISFLDIGEAKTADPRSDVIDTLKASATIVPVYGNSHSHECIAWIQSLRSFDMVMIDGGHQFPDVIADAISYGGLARKYLVFHDIMMSEVEMAFSWYVRELNIPTDKVTRIYSPNSKFGYGVIKL